MINWKVAKLLVLDVDDVRTVGSLYYDRRDETLKRFNVRDICYLILRSKGHEELGNQLV